MKFEVTIKEIHDVTAIVELPETATKDEILDAAEKAYEASENMPTEYNRPMPKDAWTVLNAETLKFI